MAIAASIEHTASKIIGSKGVQGFLDTSFAKDVQGIAAAGGISTGKGALGFGAASAIGGGVLGAGIGAYRDDSSAIGGALGGAALGLAAGGMGLMGKGIYKGLAKEEGTAAAHTAAEAIPAAVAETVASPVAGRSLKERALSAASAGVGVVSSVGAAGSNVLNKMKSAAINARYTANDKIGSGIRSVVARAGREGAPGTNLVEYVDPAVTAARRAPHPTKWNGSNFGGPLNGLQEERYVEGVVV